MAKTFAIIKNRIKLLKVLNKLEREPFLPDENRGGKVEEKLFKRCVWNISLQTYVFGFSGAMTIVGTVLLSLVAGIKDSNYRGFPYGPFTILDISDSFNYRICWVYQSSGVAIFSAAFFTIDLLICAVLANISYQFKILQNFISQTVTISYKNMMKEQNIKNHNRNDVEPSVISWRYLHEVLKRVITYHLAILDIAEEMETAFRELFLVAYLETLIMICVSVYHMTTAHGLRLLRYIAEVIAATLQVAMLSYWGEQIMEESQEVGMAAYQSDFVGTDLRFQKGLVLIMRKSLNPTVITAAKFTNIGFGSLTWILRSSYSAFMILRNSAQEH